MKTVVIVPPEPIVYPDEVPGDHASDDQTVAALIAAVQAEIDGPTGWLGRSLGFQTLATSVGGFCRQIKLPYGPVETVLNVFYRDANGNDIPVNSASYRITADGTLIFASSYAFPEVEKQAPDALTIEYTAGYSADQMPPNAKYAVIIGVQQLKPIADQNLMIREEDVEGVGSISYVVSENASSVVKRATERLLSGLWVPVA